MREQKDVTIADCVKCQHFVLSDPIAVRHLAYHVYPLLDSDVWRWNVNQLKRRWNVFNGQKVIAVVTDNTTDSLDTVRRHVDDDGAIFIELPNDPDRGEAVTFQIMMEVLWEHVEPGHAVFRAHAKAVTKPQSVADLLWADTMYNVLLDYLPLVRERLTVSLMAGCFTPMVCGMPPGRLFFPGSFYWFRHNVFERDWQKIDPGFYGVENWPGTVCRPEELTSLLPVLPGLDGHQLYDEDAWRWRIGPHVDAWRDTYKRWRT